ncbi:unnamed protein product, partial [Rotaria sp. Silwood2]
MGQQLFKVHLNIDDNIQVDSDTILSMANKYDISFFFPLKSSDTKLDSTELNNDKQISNTQTEFVLQIRNDLALLTKLVEWERINTEINDILMNNVFTFLVDQNKKVMEEINNRLTYKQHLQTLFMKKLKDDTYDNVSILSHSLTDCSSENATTSSTQTEDHHQQQNTKHQFKQLSYFAIQSLTSFLFILIKSAEKNDPTIIHEILTLASQLCEQLPMKCLSSTNSFLFKSLKPLIDYIHELSSTADPIISKQALKILLNFSIVKGSFKDIFSLLSKLIFNTTDIYNVQGLVIQLNNNLTETLNQWEKEKQTSISEEKSDSKIDNGDNTISKEITKILSIDYLKSIGSYPNTQLLNLNEELFTGQFISSIIVSHIEIK